MIHSLEGGGYMDWVILAGTVGEHMSWTRGLPRPLLPLPGTTILQSLLTSFHKSGTDGSCTICANGQTRQISEHVLPQDANRQRYLFLEDHLPLGTAGCLKACEPGLSGRSILVVGSAVWFEDDPTWMLQEHRRQGNAMTIFCTPDTSFSRADGMTLRRPAGIFCCESSVLQHIRSSGYWDMKEQLIPALRKAGLRVGAITLRQHTKEVSDWASYIEVLGRSLLPDRFAASDHTQLAPGIWCGRDVSIAPSARIVGPAVFGHGCHIDDDSVIIGPTMLGDECRVEQDTWLIRAVAPPGSTILSGTSLADQFVTAPQTSGSFDRNQAGQAPMTGDTGHDSSSPPRKLSA